MNVLNKIAFPLIILVLIFSINTSCTKDDATAMQLLFKLNENVQNYKADGDLQFNSGYITIREVVFDGERSDGESISITKEQVVSYDFATAASSPANVAVVIPDGDYTDVNLGIELQDVNGDPSIVVEGTYEKSDGVVYPIRFEFNSGEVFEATAAAVTIAPNTTAISKITFDPHVWFANVPYNRLENAEVDDNGTIVISSSSNSAIFDLVADGLDLSTQAIFQ
jgi:hypothetical protein